MGFVRGEVACEFQNTDLEKEEGKLKLGQLENEVKAWSRRRGKTIPETPAIWAFSTTLLW